MFNLGYKEIVLNSKGGITVDAGKSINIPGYLRLKAGQVSNYKKTPAEDAKVQEITFTVAALSGIAVGDGVEVVINFDSTRELSDQARDFIKHGKKIVFQSAPVATADAKGMAKAIFDGWVAFKNQRPLSEFYFDVLDPAGKAELKVKVLPGYEHITITDAKVKRAVPCTGAENCFVDLKVAKNVEGYEGHGLGKFIEESRRMATPQNVMPYAQQSGGNSQGIDVRGKYTMYLFDAKLEDVDGWQSHEYVDHAYVNAAMNSKPSHFVIYANQADSALITALDGIGSL